MPTSWPLDKFDGMSKRDDVAPEMDPAREIHRVAREQRYIVAALVRLANTAKRER